MEQNVLFSRLYKQARVIHVLARFIGLLAHSVILVIVDYITRLHRGDAKI